MVKGIRCFKKFNNKIYFTKYLDVNKKNVRLYQYSPIYLNMNVSKNTKKNG